MVIIYISQQFSECIFPDISHSNFYLIERHPKVDTGQVHDHGHGKTVSVWVEIGSKRHHHATVYHVPGGKRSQFLFFTRLMQNMELQSLMCIYLTGGFFRRKIQAVVGKMTPTDLEISHNFQKALFCEFLGPSTVTHKMITFNKTLPGGCHGLNTLWTDLTKIMFFSHARFCGSFSKEKLQEIKKIHPKDF